MTEAPMCEAPLLTCLCRPRASCPAPPCLSQPRLGALPHTAPRCRFDRGTLYCSPPTARLVVQQLRVKQSCIRCVGSPGVHGMWAAALRLGGRWHRCRLLSGALHRPPLHLHVLPGSGAARRARRLLWTPCAAWAMRPRLPTAARCRFSRPSWWRGCVSPSWTPITARGP